MKVSKRDILLLIGFIGILAAVCSYFFVYDPLMEKSKTLAAENVNLQAQVQQLTIWNENQPIYQSETKRMEEEISNIYQVFPVDVKEEDCIICSHTYFALCLALAAKLGLLMPQGIGFPIMSLSLLFISLEV